MANRIITATVTGETIKLSNKTAGAAGSFNAVSLSLTFDSAWDGTTKKLYFFDAYGNNAVYRLLTTELLVDGAYIVPIPAEPLAYAGEMTITIRGIDFATNGTTAERIIMSASTTMKVLPAIAPASDVAPVEPTPTQAEQLQGEIDGIKSTITNASASATAAANSATSASTSATAAQTAQTASESARDAAISAKTGAQTAETSAGTYATSAGNSATAAARSATDAQSAQTAAESARDAAVTAKTEAETARDAASSSKTAAATSESNAASSAAAASTSADNASASATAASTSASNASSSANASASSASAAASSASAADAAKTAAASSASAAATSETNAASSAQAAANSAASLVVVNDLTTGGTTNALSAEQGKVLSTSISTLTAQTNTDRQNATERLDDLDSKANSLIAANPNRETAVAVTTSDIASLPKNVTDFYMPNGVVQGNTLKNELNYTPSTWAEWTKTSGVAGDSTGLEFTATNGQAPNCQVSMPTAKANTKYGILYTIISSSIDGNIGIGNIAGQVFSFNNIIPKTTGNQKIVLTSQSSIASYTFGLVLGSANTTGTKIKFAPNIRIFELPSGSQIETDFTNLTADQLVTKYPYIQGGAVQSVGPTRIKSVGKNLYLRTTMPYIGTSYLTSDMVRTLKPIRIRKGISYTISFSGVVNATSWRLQWFIVDKDNNVIDGTGYMATSDRSANVNYYAPAKSYSWGTESTALKETVSFNFDCYIVVQLVNGDVTTASYATNVQFEESATATTYEPYKETVEYLPSVGNKLPNNVCDTIDLKTNTAIQNVKRYVLQASDITEMIGAVSNVDYAIVRIEKLLGCVVPIYNNALGFWTHNTFPPKSFVNSTDNIGTSFCWTTSGALIGFVFAKGTTLAQAQAVLAGTVIYYQLATPVMTKVDTYGSLISKPHGTIYVEQMLGDLGTYNNGITIHGLTFSSIETVHKVDPATGIETDVTSTCTLTANGFTSTGLVNGGLVWYVLRVANSPQATALLNYYDDKFAVVDSSNGKIYTWKITSANGVPAVALTEI